MKHKPIYLDGVDVNRCIDFNKRDKVSCYHILYDKCNENPNCYFKQLARKTQECDTLKSQLDFEVQKKECLEQECEELKSQIETYSKMLDSTEFRVALTDVRTGEREVWRKLGSKADRYLEALEEIEDFRKKHCDFLCEGNRILDIINKAKGEE